MQILDKIEKKIIAPEIGFQWKKIPVEKDSGGTVFIIISSEKSGANTFRSNPIYYKSRDLKSLRIQILIKSGFDCIQNGKMKASRNMFLFFVIGMI